MPYSFAFVDFWIYFAWIFIFNSCALIAVPVLFIYYSYGIWRWCLPAHIFAFISLFLCFVLFERYHSCWSAKSLRTWSVHLSMMYSNFDEWEFCATRCIAFGWFLLISLLFCLQNCKCSDSSMFLDTMCIIITTPSFNWRTWTIHFVSSSAVRMKYVCCLEK